MVQIVKTFRKKILTQTFMSLYDTSVDKHSKQAYMIKRNYT